MMRTLTQQQKQGLGIAVGAAVLLGYFLLLLLPAQRAAGKASRELLRTTTQLTEAEQMYRESLAAKTELAELRKQATSAYLTAPDIQASAIKEIERLTRELNITLVSIRPGEMETKDGSSKHPIEIKLESDLGRIVQFLYDLEKPERRLWVEGVEITSAKQTGDTLSATVYLAVYEPAPEGDDNNAST
jgi:Tfp pilus assembly protein PilO